MNRNDRPEEVPLMPTALIVEDEPEANHLLSMLVQLRGYRTESAYTGGEALEIACSRPPDLVFLDLMLPDINGYEVCRSLKARKTTCLIPVIMVTARVAAENRIESYRVGADDYVPKPYTPDQIFRAMNDASSWCGRLGVDSTEGVIPIDPAREEESLRQLARLRNILVARTTLDADAINRVATALGDIWRDGLEWARQSPHRLDSVLVYLVRPDHLVITLHVSSGWLAGTHFDPARRWPHSFTGARFDEVVEDETGHRLTLHKRYPPPPS
jgi:CheY-like chemotaxis protein